MGVFSIILIIIWASTIFNGIYAVAKGYFYHEEDKAKKHDPVAYRKWIRISGALLILCGAVNVTLSILDGFAESSNFIYVIFIIITVAVVIAAVAVAYSLIVKPADKALGIESEFDKILKENK